MIKKQLELILNYFAAKGLEKFRDLHRGESCYIFGDGPSVKWFDLSHFQNYPSICCGFLPFHKDFNKLNAKYCLMIEPWLYAPNFLQPKIDSIIQFRIVAEAYKSSVIEKNPDKNFFVHISNFLSLSGSNINYVYRGLPKNKNRTDEMLSQFNLFGGSFHSSLTLAYYLGFSKIYLVGFDAWTTQPARTLHWYELGNGELFEPTNFATEFLEILKGKIDIYTISVEGKSQNVTNISYENYTGNPPQYKENIELIDEYYLNVLATYPGYNIFPQ